MSWRDLARPIVAKVVGRIGLQDRQALRKALQEAYPFGERRYLPYRAWLAEIRAQTGGLNRRRNKRNQAELI